MARYDKCIDRIMRAAGRQLKPDQIEAVFERIHQAALDLKNGRKPPKLGKRASSRMGLLPHQAPAMENVIIQAAQYAAVDMVYQAETKLQQANLQVLKLNARGQDFKALTMKGMAPLDAIRMMIARDYSGRIDIESLEQRVTGATDYYRAKLQETWKALGNDMLGFFQDPEKALLLVKELRGENTGDAMAKRGAEAFHDVAEEARESFNRSGGDVGRLDDWGMPQHHSQEKVAAIGRDAWVADMMNRVDRARYADDAGVPFTDQRMQEFLGKAWDNIATDGLASMEPGKRGGSGKVANRHSEERQIHFKDAQAVIDYWTQFGEKTLVEVLDGHIGTMARDIAFVEKFGPNPNTTYQTLRDTALRDTAMADPTKTIEAQGNAVKLDELWNYASGRTKASANLTMSGIADAIANLNVAGKLGGAVLASLFGDKVMYEAVGHMNNIPAFKRWGAEIAMLNPANAVERRLLERNGLMLDSVRSGLNRFYEGLGKSDWTGKLANAVMRVTGMNAINELRKGAFGLNMFSAIGNEIAAGKSFADLDKSDVRLLRNWGIDEADWNVWKLATRVKIKGADNVLLPEAIKQIKTADLQAAGVIPAGQGPEIELAADNARRDATVKLLGAVNTESEFAVVTPGWNERAAFYGDLQRGTIKGEIVRSMLQFKSFPWAYLHRGMDAVANQEGAVPKAAMVAFLITANTLAGAMILQTREVLAGKDPRGMMDENWMKFWGAAFLQGGALGIYGDFLYGATQTRYGSGILEALAGPTVGPILEMGLVQPMQAAKARMEGKESHLAAQTIQDLKGFIPGGNIWYAKAALDHLIWQNVMETLSPGYLANIRARTQKEYGQRWYWEPGETTPDRAPDFMEAVR